MSSSNKQIQTDVNNKPVPQYYNEATDAYEVQQGAGGAPFVSLMGSSAITPNTYSATTTAGVISASSQPCSEVLVQASNKNTDWILIGNASEQVIEILPGASVPIPCNNVNLLYAIAVSGTQKLNWLARS